MQKEIELKCLCDGLLDALREMGLGKYSLRNYYYEGMWPLIKAYRKAGKELYDPVFTNEVVLGIQKQFQEGLVGNHISMHVRKMAALDRHAVYSRQRVDAFKPDDIASTQSARQHKDATDLICQPTYQQTVGTIGYTDHKGVNNQFVSEDKCVVEHTNLIRRLTPLECERLQGFPDGWTNIPDASDSARYKALGNSVAIPCVDYVLHGIALAFQACT